MRAGILAAVAALIVVAVAAGSTGARPAAHPPDAAALRALGLRVAWPVGTRTTALAPGDRVVVRVARVGHGARRAVRLALVRVDGTGRALRTVAHRTLRAGTFSVRLPAAAGAHYALRLDVAGRHFIGWIHASRPASTGATGPGAAMPGPTAPTPAAPGAPVSSPPQPPSSGGPPSCPQSGTAQGELTASPTSGAPNATVQLTLKNTGTACLTGGLEYGWDHFVGGSWESVPDPGYAWPAIAELIAPGTASTSSATVWPGLAPGTYRITKRVSGPDGQALVLYAPFSVTS